MYLVIVNNIWVNILLLNTRMIQQITYEEIFPIWEKHLWPGRVSKIEPTSAMNFLGGYDLRNMVNPTFFGYKIYGTYIGVNSGHPCHDQSYRSRGLYVFPEYRHLGIGKLLLEAAIAQGKKEKATYIWSYPKYSSWRTYQSVGFELASNWESSEMDTNAYCRLNLI